MLLARGDAAFDARHGIILSEIRGARGRLALKHSLQAVRGPLFHVVDICAGEHVGPAILTDILRVVAHQAVALAGDTMLDLAGRGELEALLHTAFGLKLGHFHLLDRDTSNQPWQPLRPDRQRNHVSVKGAQIPILRANASQKWVT